jgi:hypothetical protein
LREGLALPELLEPNAPDLFYAIVPSDRALGSVRTLEISADTYKLLSWLQRTPATSTPVAPGLERALAQLQTAGLLVTRAPVESGSQRGAR